MDPGVPADNAYVLEMLDELHHKVGFLEKANRVLLNEVRHLQTQIDRIRGEPE